MKVEAIQHADVKGKIQNYIKITKGDSTVLINVGQKTYQSVKDLEKIDDQIANFKEANNLEEINKPKANRR